jgi:hypothetical protein
MLNVFAPQSVHRRSAVTLPVKLTYWPGWHSVNDPQLLALVSVLTLPLVHAAH